LAWNCWIRGASSKKLAASDWLLLPEEMHDAVHITQPERCSAAKRTSIVVVCAANCVISWVSTCLYYQELHRLGSFPFFTTQLNSSMGAILSAAGLLVARRFEPHNNCPQSLGIRRWLTISLLLAVQNTLEIASIQRMGNDNLAPILQQASVPLTFALSALLLRARYRWTHLTGATVIVAGIFAGFIPVLLMHKAHVQGIWVAIFLVSRVPQAAAGVMSEGSLRDRSHFAWAFRATLYTQVLGLPCNFLAALLLNVVAKPATGGVLQDYRGGVRCLFADDAGTSSSSLCPGAARAVLLFAVPGCLYTLSEFQVMQRTSAAVYFLLAALQLPVQDALLSVPAVMGDLRSQFHPPMAFSIAVVAAGLSLYSCGDPPHVASSTAYDCCGPEAADQSDQDPPTIFGSRWNR